MTEIMVVSQDKKWSHYGLICISCIYGPPWLTQNCAKSEAPQDDSSKDKQW